MFFVCLFHIHRSEDEKTKWLDDLYEAIEKAKSNEDESIFPNGKSAADGGANVASAPIASSEETTSGASSSGGSGGGEYNATSNV